MRFIRTAVVAASLAALGAVTAAPASAIKDHTIRYLSTNPVNTDIDLGAPGLSAGNKQVFTNDAVRDGKKIGFEAGECTVVLVTKERLAAHCVSTLVLEAGTITTQGVFQEVLRDGPRTLTTAVTGGTGRYRGASGQGLAVFIPNTDNGNVTISLD